MKRALTSVIAVCAACAACAVLAGCGRDDTAQRGGAAAAAADAVAQPDTAHAAEDAHAGHAGHVEHAGDAGTVEPAAAAAPAAADVHAAHGEHAAHRAAGAAPAPDAAASHTVRGDHAAHTAAARPARAVDAAQATAPQSAHAGHEDHAAHALPATDGPGYTVADVRFMQDMIGHHAQALEMSALAPSRAASDHVKRLAEKIDISQRDEIDMMKRWLVERGQAVPDEAHVHAMHMPGMLTPAQMAQLSAARGAAFDRLFLELMIQHHEGAIHMVDALFASPRAAEDSEIFRFATDVMTDQTDEIDVMTHMLHTLVPDRGGRDR